MSAGGSLCVAHLVHRRNGLDPLRRFLCSYGEHTAGADHELVLLLKGFPSEHAAAEHMGLAPPGSRGMVVPEGGYDLTAYWHAAARLDHHWICFVNSFSEILADDWLGLLTRPLADTAVGIAGATGSWASQRGYLAYQLGLPSRYAEAFAGRGTARAAFRALDGARDRGWLLHKAGTALDYLRRLRGFAPFPAPHLRTNAFAARRALLAEIKLPPIRGKLDAHRFESGCAGLTAQVGAMGLKCIVVGRDGISYEAADWPDSSTFSQRDQENLLVADNRTNLYARSGADGRRHLSALAWGDRARPG